MSDNQNDVFCRPPVAHVAELGVSYPGQYLSISAGNRFEIQNKCTAEDRATFVTCPPLVCGVRLTIHNPFRPQEVDTSNEIVEAEFVNVTQDDQIVSKSRVVGGEPSQPASWPWIVTVYKNGIFHCSGAIVNDMWVVTAAHCLDK